MMQAANEEQTETLAKRYLLGTATDEEQVQLEERCLADHAFYEQMRAVEDHLIDDYVYDQLNPLERRQFEHRLLTIPVLKERVAFAQTLRQAVAQASDQLQTQARVGLVSATDFAAKPASHFWQTLKRTFFDNAPALRVALAVAAACLLLAFTGLLFARRQARETAAQTNAGQQRIQALQAQLNQQQQTNAALNHQLQLLGQELAQLKAANPLPTLAARVLTFSLSLGKRGADITTVVIPAKTVSIRLILPVVLDENLKRQPRSLRARLLTTSGDEVWVKDKLPLNANQRQKAVMLAMPANLFASQEYLVRLSQVNADGSSNDIGDYYFAVTRP